MSDLDLGATIKGFSPGQKVCNRYVLRRLLGRGGMGVVWLGWDGELEREVALKFLPEVVALDREAVRDLKRETRRSLELTHSHIVRIHDFVQDARTAAISMEYIAGSTLAERKLDQPAGHLEVADLEAWVRQALDALDYAHRKAGVVHRDLKPANLMIDARGDLKIADFGIAASVSDSVSRVSAQAGTAGTPYYMSPQQMMGDKPAVTDDLYSLGATLYELLTGKPPFHTGNVVAQVQHKVPPGIAERRRELGVAGAPVPEAWERAIAACLAKDPAARPVDAATLGRMLATPAAPTSVPRRGDDLEATLALTAEERRSGGTFVVNVTRGFFTLQKEIPIPAGVGENAVLRVRGQGMAGEGGGEPGNLFIRILGREPVAPPPATPVAADSGGFLGRLPATVLSSILLAAVGAGLVVHWRMSEGSDYHWRIWEYPAALLWIFLWALLAVRGLAADARLALLRGLAVLGTTTVLYHESIEWAEQRFPGFDAAAVTLARGAITGLVLALADALVVRWPGWAGLRLPGSLMLWPGAGLLAAAASLAGWPPIPEYWSLAHFGVPIWIGFGLIVLAYQGQLEARLRGARSGE